MRFGVMVNSVEEFVVKVKQEWRDWRNHIDSNAEVPWFRGQPDCQPLKPGILRRSDYSHNLENYLMQTFRMQARAFTEAPTYGRIDEWLFLARHAGLPTRVLDWSEGALIALFLSRAT